MQTSWLDIIDDKMAVIIAVLIITITAMLILKIDAKEIAMQAITGLMGIAVGRSLKDPPPPPPVKPLPEPE